MRFYETDRAVKTASKLQVRKGIYKSSVGKWKNYAPYLKPLIDSLKAHASMVAESNRAEIEA